LTSNKNKTHSESMGKEDKKVEGPALGIDLGTTCTNLRVEQQLLH